MEPGPPAAQRQRSDGGRSRRGCAAPGPLRSAVHVRVGGAARATAASAAAWQLRVAQRLRRGVRNRRHRRRWRGYILAGAPFRRYDPLGILRLERLVRPGGALGVLVEDFAVLGALVDLRRNLLRGLRRNSLRMPRGEEEQHYDRERMLLHGAPFWKYRTTAGTPRRANHWPRARAT